MPNLTLPFMSMVALVVFAFFAGMWSQKRTIDNLDGKASELRHRLGPLLDYVAYELARRGIYMYNEPGTGDLDYRIGEHVFSFNQFAGEFKGFQIDGHSISIKAFMREVLAAPIKEEENGGSN